jgi:hypothetical protein
MVVNAVTGMIPVTLATGVMTNTMRQSGLTGRRPAQKPRRRKRR